METHVDNAALVSSTLSWWHAAGVDMLVADEPRRWLDAEQRSARSSQTPAAAAAALPSSPVVPTSLPALRQWLLDTDLVPDFGPKQRRLAFADAPAGALMILTDMPEADDHASGAMFGGGMAAMIDRMLAAIGLSRDAVYLAAMLPARTATGDFDAATRELVEATARAHVRLAAPAGLWLMGNAASRAVLGIDDVRAHGRLHDVNLDGVMVKAIATAHPRLLTPARKELRSRVWADMQRLVEKDV